MKKNNRGFSLIETMMALAIFLVGIIPVAKMISQVKNNFSIRSADAMAYLYGQNLMSEIQSKKWDQNVAGLEPEYLDLSTQASLTLGEETLPIDVNNFDDIDDYVNLPPIVQDQYKLSTEVDYIDDPAITPDSISLVPTDWKRVTVKIHYGKTLEKEQKIIYIATNGS